MGDKVISQSFDQLDYIPKGLLDSTPESLHTLLAKPTLIHLTGKHQEPLFVSVLLHGNEPTGFFAVQQLLLHYQNKELPRSISIFFGNINAASLGLRRLENQPDYNRIWPGTPLEDCLESLMVSQVVEIMRSKNIFASIDIHNNTGLNPHYACINRLDAQFLHLATLFGRFVVYFTRPQGVQSAAFAPFCPSVTLECGRPGQQYGVEHALDFLNSCIHLAEFPTKPIHHQDIDLYHTVAQVNVKSDVEFSFQQQVQLLLDPDLEKLNFTDVDAGTVIGQVNDNNDLPVIAYDEHGNDVSEQYFAVKSKQLIICRSTMPSMLTLDEKVIQQDCLCYLMERLAIL